MSIEIGTEGDVTPGMRRGLPTHIDGVPVRETVRCFSLPRRYSMTPEPLPMIELREDDDGGNSVAARWPEPFDRHRLEGGR